MTKIIGTFGQADRQGGHDLLPGGDRAQDGGQGRHEVGQERHGEVGLAAGLGGQVPAVHGLCHGGQPCVLSGFGDGYFDEETSDVSLMYSLN